MNLKHPPTQVAAFMYQSREQVVVLPLRLQQKDLTLLLKVVRRPKITKVPRAYSRPQLKALVFG